VNPASGGIPAIENKIKIIENTVMFVLFQTWKLLIVLTFFTSNKNKTQKKRYSTTA